MAAISTYQEFSVQMINGGGADPGILNVTVGWTAPNGTYIDQITEISFNNTPYQPMVLNVSTYKKIVPVPNGSSDILVNIKIKEANDKIYDLGDYFFHQVGTGCKNMTGDLIKTIVSIKTHPALDPLTIASTIVSNMPVVDHSIDGGANYVAATGSSSGAQSRFSNWSLAQLQAEDPLTIQLATKTDNGTDSLNCVRVSNVNYTFPEATLSATEIHTNPTTNGGTDGSITVVVANGSGNFSFLWSDLSTTNPRNNLAAGTYNVTITDDDTLETFDINNIVLTEPAEEIIAFPNTFSKSSPINPIRFKENISGEDLPLENYNFCEQPTEEMTKLPTHEIFNVQDQTILQFISDYSGNVVKKINIDTGAFEILSLSLVKDNLSGGQTNNITISDNGLFLGLSTIRLNRENLPAYPNPSVGDLVVISSSASYDGSYAIVDISINGLYVVVNTPFLNIEPAQIKFVSPNRFNVFELPILFNDWGVGNYKLEFESTDGNLNTFTKLVSENIAIKAQTPNTILFTYSNNDTSFGVVWGTEIVMRKRHEGFFVKAVPTRDSTNFRNSNDRPAILNAYVRNKEEYKLHLLTWFSIQRLALIFTCDNMQINGKNMFVEELPETEQSDSRFLLSNITFIAEEIGWLDDQNTHDIGDTSEVSIVIGGDLEEVLGV